MGKVRYVGLVECPKCEKRYLPTEMEETGECRWCKAQADFKRWMDWREKRNAEKRWGAV